MLKLREPHMQAMGMVARRNFVEQTVADIQQASPKHRQLLDEAALPRLVEHGIHAAGQYGVESGRNVSIWVELMLKLGAFFDMDPQFPWAGEILRDRRFRNETVRTNALNDRAWEFAVLANGSEGEHLASALQRAAAQSLDDWLAVSSDILKTQLRTLHPHRYAAVGEAALGRLIRQGVQTAASYGIEPQNGGSIYIAMMFLLGAGFDRDPLCSWAPAVLRDTSLENPLLKTKMLYAEAINQLALWAT